MGQAMKATLVLSVAAFVLAGCEMKLGDTGASKKVAPPENVKTGDAAFLDEAPIRQEPETKTGGAVETALEWAKKYADVSEQLNQEQQQKQVLLTENNQLKEQVSKLQTDLKRAEAELAEGNQMLVEMRQELEKWKASVLGFRDEIRQAQKAQLDALAKILSLISGEPVASPAAGTPRTNPAAPATQEAPAEKEQPDGEKD